MFPRTSVFLKTAKNPLTCSRKRKVQKISPRHQSKRLEPCGMRDVDDEGVSLDFTCYRKGFKHFRIQTNGTLVKLPRSHFSYTGLSLATHFTVFRCYHQHCRRLPFHCYYCWHPVLRPQLCLAGKVPQGSLQRKVSQ